MSAAGAAPAAAWPVAAWWPGAPEPPRVARADEARGLPGCWLVEIVTPQGGGVAVVPPVVAAGFAPVASLGLPQITPSAPPELRVSDRGWIGEPDDALMPHAAYPARLAEPPALELALPLYPDAPRRAALAAGELVLLNGDGALDALASDWRLAHLPVRVSRGPHRRPRHAPRGSFGVVAELRAAGAAYAAGTAGEMLRLPLTHAGADLEVPVCETYGGTGGADGHAQLAGTPKPRLYGLRRNFEPVLEDTGRLIYRCHHGGRMEAVLGVRDRGVALAAAGDVASYAALQAVSPAAGTYVTCLAEGCLRVGSQPSLLTVDARGDATGGYVSDPGAIAARLLATAGGIGPDRIAGFGWPAGEAGLLLRTGGTVADALDALAAGCGGWWGADAFGRFRGGVLSAPEALGPSLAIEPWHLAGPPEEAGRPRAPWWRARVLRRPNARVQSGEELAASVSAADRDLYGRPGLVETALDLAVQAAYPAAEDGPQVDSLYDEAAPAQAMAARLMALFGRPRRAWAVRLAAWLPGAVEVGAAVTLRWPHHPALRDGGRPLLVISASLRGDAAELVLWG